MADYRKLRISDILDYNIYNLELIRRNPEKLKEFQTITKKAVDFAKRRQKSTERVIAKRESEGFKATPTALRKNSIVRSLVEVNEVSKLDFSQLLEQYRYATRFLEAKTSVIGDETKGIEGWDTTLKSFVDTISNKIRENFGIEVRISEKDYDLFWEIYNKAKEDARVGTKGKEINYELYRDTAQLVENIGLYEGMSVEELVSILTQAGVEEEIEKRKNEEEDSEITIDYNDIFN